MKLSRDYVVLLYETLLGRLPDPEGLAHHSAVLEQTGDLRLVVDALTNSEEYASRHIAQTVSTQDEDLGRPLVIVDVGAQKLESEDHAYFALLNSGFEWRCIGFEPLNHRRTDRMADEHDSRLTMLDAFVGDGGRHTFRMVNDDGSSSLLALNDVFIRDYEHICTLKTAAEEEVQTETLDKLLERERAIDFLKLDIQGFESRALAYASETLRRTNVVHCECLFGPMYIDQSYFSDIDNILRSAGFEFIDLTYLARYRYVAVPRPSTTGERLIWADAIYFRKLDPGRDPKSSFMAQALIAETVYRKPGLAQQIRHYAETAL